MRGREIQINPITDFYDKQSSTYDEIQGCSYWEILYSEYNRWIKRYVDAQDLKIIDLGCGTGLTSDLLVEKLVAHLDWILLCHC